MNNWPRIANILLGVWLFISAFAWMHSPQQFTNTWLVGAGIALFGLIGLATPSARYVNLILAVWLFISAWALPTVATGTLWNNILVALAVFILSLIPSSPARSDRDVEYIGRPPRTV